MDSLRWELVTRSDALEALSGEIRHAPLLAIDTEFVRRVTFFARPGLLQLSVGSGEWLVDLVEIADLRALHGSLTGRDPVKVMHACGEDLEVLKTLCGAPPGSLFDTQVAAAMLGHSLQTSYQKLVKAVLDVDVPKDETQSDWTARPLSESQLSYAALDVRYLLPLWDALRAQLQARGRLHWLQEDCDRLLSDAAREIDPQAYYRQVSGAWKLSREGLSVLSALAAWRERTARLLDKPRSHIVPDAVLLLVAQRRPRSLAQLGAIPDLHPAMLRRHGNDVLACLSGSPLPPVEPVPAPLPREARALLASMRDEVSRVAATHAVEPEVLVRRRHLEAIVESARQGEPELPPALQGWRRDLVGEALLRVAREHLVEIRSWKGEDPRHG